MSENLEAVQCRETRAECVGVGRRRPTAKSARKHKEREATSRGDMGTGGTEENLDQGTSEACLCRIEGERGTV